MVSAWVYVIWGAPKYLVGAITSAASLRRVNTCHDIVLLYAMEDGAELEELKAAKVFTEIRKIDLLRYKVRDLPTKRQQELYGGEFSETICTKWQCLQLDSYQKVMYIDCDIVFQKNCDFIFSVHAPAGTFSSPFAEPYSKGGIRNCYGRPRQGTEITVDQARQGLKNGFVALGGMILLEPCRKTLDEYKKWMAAREPYGHPHCHSGIDDQSITEFYADRNISWHHIEPIYQAIPWKQNWLPGVDILKRAFGLHFYHDKPWEKGEGTGWEDTKVFWRIYHQMERDYPRLAKSIRPLVTNYVKQN